jgi:3-hydroxybutyryl-CoA dehydrogenase
MRVGVIGGGLMGSGIAEVCARSGVDVTVVEVDDARADQTRAKIEKSLDRAARSGKLAADDRAAAGERLAYTTRVEDLEGADAAIEAVVEDEQTKRELFLKLDEILPDADFLASNTSSVPIMKLAADTSKPDRVLGMHFFNPVPASKLVEVVVAPETAADVVESTRGWVRALGKTDVVVKDSPGFASSRLGVLLGLEAIRMLEEGVADAEAIDAAMELGYRHPMGPLRLTDLVGLDVRLDIARNLTRELGPRFTPPQILIDKVAAGELGKKSGKGFYDWSE